MRLVFRAVVGVVGRRRGAAARTPGIDERLEADEIDRLLEPFANLVLDARVEIVRAVGVAERHQPSMARSPEASGTGVRPNVEKNADGSQVLSSSSMSS